MTASTGAALGTEAARRLLQVGHGHCEIEPGLTDREFARIEAEFAFEFAADHRAFLAAGLPTSVPYNDPPGVIRTHRQPWPDWRDGDPAQLREALNHPTEGVLFDVQNNAFWHPTWGPRPGDADEALATARDHLAAVPTLVPVYGHRYLPAGRGDHGHPVLSVWQTDIICYGLDLADYIYREFGAAEADHGDAPWDPQVSVEFWRDFV
jgi:hypothetical protein